VGLARALYGDPRLVVLDEPDASLDSAGDAALMTALARLKQEGVTTVMITHKPALLAEADKILVLENGTMTRFGTPEEVHRQLTGDN
jgi:ABC-type protease/lipase transport system fused ATPase/permease subunit